MADDDKKKERGINADFYFDEELTSFALHLESDKTMEVKELGDFLIEFGQGLKTGDVPMYDISEEVLVH